MIAPRSTTILGLDLVPGHSQAYCPSHRYPIFMPSSHDSVRHAFVPGCVQVSVTRTPSLFLVLNPSRRRKLRKRQITWLPCEVEALSIAAAVKHFNPYIVQSLNTVCVLTDSKPCLGHGETSSWTVLYQPPPSDPPINTQPLPGYGSAFRWYRQCYR